MFGKILIANRGEIALRIQRACKEMGIKTVVAHSLADTDAKYVRLADESVCIGPAPVHQSYLNMPALISAAEVTDAEAIHPGYGFLSENADFAERVESSGFVFIGPRPETIRLMGDKVSAKQAMIDAGVPCVPGSGGALPDDPSEIIKIARSVGYPVIIKASGGGGGRGMRIVNDPADLEKEFNEARNESKKAFGDDMIFVEKYLKGPKHIEVQVIGDNYGNVVHLFDRDCSVQRRHQKVVEYAPAFTIPDETREKIFDAAIRLCKNVGYVNAGTLEFLVDRDNNPYFIEMNPRIQVEHTVSEMVTGIDIVQAQILVAEGYALDSEEIHIKSQEDVTCNGYSIQTRVTSEDPANNFLPDTGEMTVYRSGSGNGIRLDGGCAYVGAVVSPHYDSLLVKIISHDRTFAGAVRKSERALQEMRIRGVKTNIPFLINVLNHPTFQSGQCYTTFIEETPELFRLTHSLNRATKIIEFIGDRIINSDMGKKKQFDNRILPTFDHDKPVYGARDEFLKLGAEGYMQKILKEEKLYVTDTSMRDAQQSLVATRMRSKDLCGAAYATNAFMQNAFSVEAWGGATFDTAYRFLKESPWKRLTTLRERMPNTLIQMLLRASNAVGYSNYPDNLVKEFIQISAENGIDVFRIFRQSELDRDYETANRGGT